MVAAEAASAVSETSSTIIRLRMAPFVDRKKWSREQSRAGAPAGPDACSTPGDALGAVGDAIDRARVIVRDQERAVLHDVHVHRPPNVLVILEEAGEKRLDRLHSAVLV